MPPALAGDIRSVRLVPSLGQLRTQLRRLLSIAALDLAFTLPAKAVKGKIDGDEEDALKKDFAVKPLPARPQKIQFPCRKT